ncbi:AAA family ATPase [Alkaliphilus oremlandii]|uniref:ATPase associated with various cellular activities AAA_3 n=1 Tax=Alkaliphilus oremlandii (strain OhILAs) TaxID=350688 RepID=A8MK52_ALKOO|nr:MoxR family ATPase [Alkaliphilus oremlandii]ABW20184.1 ATPase associated with various cellular activities AAA_3 [Alkaliphilus oremlandii OhILAs]
MGQRAKAKEIIENMKKVIIGKDGVLENVMVCFLARGHLLIEDVPGLGKTTLVKALAKSVDLTYGRIQFTPDLMPSDITGITIYNKQKEDFIFRKGPIFNQVILADEINRTSPKTQSSLLQGLEEGQVSVEDVTYNLEQPFIVLATQNPIEHYGTFPLPEAQLDRFLMKISIGYPSAEEEKEIIRNSSNYKDLKHIRAVATKEELLKMQEEVDRIYVSEDVLDYITNIVAATREEKSIQLGASPRASIDLFRASKALAYIKGREFVIPDDVKKLAPSILNHRIVLSIEAKMEGKKAEEVIGFLLKNIYIPVVSKNDR